MIPNLNKNGEICSICGKRFYEFENNARPINTGSWSDICNETIVFPIRRYFMRKYNAGDCNELLITISYDKE